MESSSNSKGAHGIIVMMTCPSIGKVQDEMTRDLESTCTVIPWSCTPDALDLQAVVNDSYLESQWGVHYYAGLSEDIKKCSGFVFSFTPSVRALDRQQKDMLMHFVDVVKDLRKCLIILLEKSCSLTELQDLHPFLDRNRVMIVDQNNGNCGRHVSLIIRHLLRSHDSSIQQEAGSWIGIWTDAICKLEKLYASCHAAHCTYPNDDQHYHDAWTVYVHISHGLLIQLFAYLGSIVHNSKGASEDAQTLCDCKVQLEKLSHSKSSVTNLGLRPGAQQADHVREIILKIYPLLEKEQYLLSLESSFITDEEEKGLQRLQKQVHDLCSVFNETHETVDQWAKVITAATSVQDSIQQLLDTIVSREVNARLHSLLPFIDFVVESEKNSFVIRSCDIYFKLLRSFRLLGK